MIRPYLFEKLLLGFILQQNGLAGRQKKVNYNILFLAGYVHASTCTCYYLQLNTNSKTNKGTVLTLIANKLPIILNQSRLYSKQVRIVP